VAQKTGGDARYEGAISCTVCPLNEFLLTRLLNSLLKQVLWQRYV